MQIRFFLLIAFVWIINFLQSCKKLVEVDAPVNKPEASVVYQSDAMATAVLTGIYNQISTNSFATGNSSISLIAGLTADELTAYSSSGSYQLKAFQNSLSINEIPLWSELYKYIYTSNTAIESILQSPSLKSEVKNQLLGEAKFMRAFLNFYLVNLWGDIPLVLTTDFEKNSVLSRSSKDIVYQSIIEDLKDAQGLLSETYVDITLQAPTNERIRPNKYTATALLSRAYLYNSNYQEAENEASKIINNTALYDTVSLNNVFLKNSKEAIWQLQPVYLNYNTDDARTFILTGEPNSAQPVSVSNKLLQAFEFGDQRKIKWIKAFVSGSNTYYSPYKYKVNQPGALLSEYLMVFRIGEQYLIRAEARAVLNNVTGAISDLNIIRKRAGLSNTSAISKQELISAVLVEKQKELFTEWGHRWLDLKRTDIVDIEMSIVAPMKGSSWEATDKLFPIPLIDIQRNKNLYQNSGYN